MCVHYFRRKFKPVTVNTVDGCIVRGVVGVVGGVRGGVAVGGVCTLRRVNIMWKRAMVRVNECTGEAVAPTAARTHRVHDWVHTV